METFADKLNAIYFDLKKVYTEKNEELSTVVDPELEDKLISTVKEIKEALRSIEDATTILEGENL